MGGGHPYHSRGRGGCPGVPLTPVPTHSPFKIKVLPAHDASKVRASGPGLSASGIPASLPVEFTIDARDAGEGLLTVQILVSTRGSRGPRHEAGLALRRRQGAGTRGVGC